MAVTDFAFEARVAPAADDIWTWWQSRRLAYNLGLAAAGIAAYLVNVALARASGVPMWAGPQDAISTTLALGVAYLVVMGIANVCFLLGPLSEAVMRPADPRSFRRSAFAMGFWASIALPFAVPAITLAAWIGLA